MAGMIHARGQSERINHAPYDVVQVRARVPDVGRIGISVGWDVEQVRLSGRVRQDGDIAGLYTCLSLENTPSHLYQRSSEAALYTPCLPNCTLLIFTLPLEAARRNARAMPTFLCSPQRYAQPHLPHSLTPHPHLPHRLTSHPHLAHSLTSYPHLPQSYLPWVLCPDSTVLEENIQEVDIGGVDLDVVLGSMGEGSGETGTGAS